MAAPPTQAPLPATDPPQVLCIGAVHWDMIGRSATALSPGADVPGRIIRQPGGVALNIAATLARLGVKVAVLGAIGSDGEGDALLSALAGLGVDGTHVCRPAGSATDRYMAIEGPGGLVAAIADGATLEAAGARILEPLADGRLGRAANPWPGVVVIDGNLPRAVLASMAGSPLFSRADLRLAPASPAKAARMAPLVRHPRATLYANLAEAGVLAGKTFATAAEAAATLVAQGAARVLVTDGARGVAEARAGAAPLTRPAPAVTPRRVTGAGDTFLAAHLAAELCGADRNRALARALAAAAAHVAEGPLP